MSLSQRMAAAAAAAAAEDKSSSSSSRVSAPASSTSSISKSLSLAERIAAVKAADEQPSRMSMSSLSSMSSMSSSLQSSQISQPQQPQQTLADKMAAASQRDQTELPLLSSSRGSATDASISKQPQKQTLADKMAAASQRDQTELPLLSSSRFSQRMQPTIFFHKEYENYGFLSNFYRPVRFLDPESNLVFTSSEKYYMAAKAAVARNAQSFFDIMETDDPSLVKEIGSSFGVPREWERVREDVMEYACYLKFFQNHDIRRALLDTGDAHLVEAAPNDNVWGIGINETQARQTNPSTWPGANLLGKVLMKVRKHLKDNTVPEASHIISEFTKTSQELQLIIRHSSNSSKTSSQRGTDVRVADLGLAGVPEVDDEGYANIIELLTHFANGKEHFNILDQKNAKVNAFKIEQLMHDKHVADGNANVSPTERENMRVKIATKYIPRFIEEQRQLQQRQSSRGQRQPQSQIYSMGFLQADVDRALAQAKGDEERAIEILIGQQQPQQPQQRKPQQREPQQRQPQQREPQQQQPQSKYDKVTRLYTRVRQDHYYWIDREMVENALELNNNDDDQAYLYLTTQIPEPPKEDSKEIAFIREMPVRRVGGAGNCLFLSLVGSLTNLFEHIEDEASLNNPALNDGASMRQAIVGFERQHYNEPAFYEAVAINFEPTPLQSLDTSIMLYDSVRVERELNYGTVDEYFPLMERDGAYGTNVEIMAAAQMFGVTIFVQILEDDMFVRYDSSNPQHNESRAIYLFKADNMGHYDWKDPYLYSKHGGGKQKQQKQQKQQKSRKMNCKKLSKRETRYKKIIYKYSNPTQAQKMATKYLGKTAKLYPANNPVKKYRICDPVSKKWVNFGQLGYEDYTRHKDKTRRHNYLTRTAGIKGNWKSNKFSANNLSRKIIWN